MLAGTAHGVGGGHLPSAGVLTLAGMLLGLGAVTVTARRCRPGVLLGLLAVQQLILHLVFEAASATAAGCGGMAAAAGHHAAALGHAGATCTVMPMAGTGATGMPGWAMWLGHLAATLLTALLLARGEAWLWRVAERAVNAATAAPSHRRARQHRHLGAVAPVTPGRSPAYTPAAPRGPPHHIVVS